MRGGNQLTDSYHLCDMNDAGAHSYGKRRVRIAYARAGERARNGQ